MPSTLASIRYEARDIFRFPRRSRNASHRLATSSNATRPACPRTTELSCESKNGGSGGGAGRGLAIAAGWIGAAGGGGRVSSSSEGGGGSASLQDGSSRQGEVEGSPRPLRAEGCAPVVPAVRVPDPATPRTPSSPVE